MNSGSWNWLEITKLIAGLLTPTALAVLGVYLHRLSKRFEHQQWRSQKLIEKRLAVYDDLAPDFNDLLCYFTYVGCWKELDPLSVLALKRTTDKKIHLAAPLFSEPFFDECMRFQNLCFETYSGWGKDALLRTQFERRKQARPNDWHAEWDKCFSKSPSHPKNIQEAYSSLMWLLATDIGVHPTMITPRLSCIPKNIR